MKGHEKSITTVKYNADGDLLFTASKDHRPTVWYSDTGDRLGTFSPHGGAVWDLDPNWDSTYLVTACADFRARLFEITTGEYVAQMIHKGVVRSVKWGDGSQRFVTAADPFTSRDLGTISVYNFPSPEDLTEGMLYAPVRSILPFIDVVSCFHQLQRMLRTIMVPSTRRHT